MMTALDKKKLEINPPRFCLRTAKIITIHMYTFFKNKVNTCVQITMKISPKVKF